MSVGRVVRPVMGPAGEPAGGQAQSLRVALLSYRSKPFCGGQGIYVRHLSRELVHLGHRVEVFSGPPYPVLDAGVTLTALPSLDLYREPDPFRVPRRQEFTSAVDVLEFALMSTATFPEPLTFSLRAYRALRGRLRDFDVVHDNQSLGYGLLGLRGAGVPIVATLHHPITVDRRLDLAAAPTLRRQVSVRRWYAFLAMQKRVARRLDRLATVSQSSYDDIVRDFGVAPSALTVVPIGVDPDVFRPPALARIPGRIVATASADVPLKGLVPLLEAVAKLRTECAADLVVVGSARPGGLAARAIDRLGLSDCVRFTSGLPEPALVALLGSAQVVVVPSLYEGFSLPAIEAMACATPLVVTTAGALPEVVGHASADSTDRSGAAALLVPPGDAGALAGAIGELLCDAALRERLGAAGRARVVARFTWRAAAQATASWYRDAISDTPPSRRRTPC